ncbi:DUF805 domain-containing protein [Pseudomonas sp. FW306-02-F02-AA]|uniref:DUF805 domain-containing protein n=1 Tax=Pseudomonas fluorescens TaxID=294 RepID=A0A0N9WH16_PSEFL|nr:MULTISPECIES: DUF805 domain-containing protein [Pseudomonas]ALI00840.1 hypothetical protein AO353_07170 [Pseudomonas fluorescens]PMZ00971.1 DUF805 domain-containing protein [Pseudomonas sp. FW306-02-F02-AB]PMZ09574.1 DUF805 domain-containing protein [Pseudomonas sp. FW306-02-H06C]PMZ15157.1 DUF805 domain-containing protein [Pseudomonas sp. FW306-02-F02-AA]PMZ23484.1 DUF805 domain-containing protein [Pseudomonas sp. FW306-02-F08-AA]
MSEHRFKIVFDGALLPGVDITTAKLNLAQLFKSDVAAIERLFSGKPVALKHDLSHADAQTYLNALSKTGIDARIETEPSIKLNLTDVHDSSSAAYTAPTLGNNESPYSPPRAPVGEALPEFSELKVFSVQGRIGRLRYLAWSLVALLIMGAIAGVFGLSLLSGNQIVLSTIVCVVAFVAYLYINITISVQRLHDLGWSGWLWFLNLVPFIGSLFPFALAALPGNVGANRYGAPQPPNSTAVKVLCGLWLVVIAVFFVGALAGGLSTLTEEYESTSTSSYGSSEPADAVEADDAAKAAQPPVDYEKE